MNNQKTALKTTRKEVYTSNNGLSRKGILFLISLFFSISSINAQEESLENKILEMDAIFWKAYNECDVKVMNNYLAEDIEFYHDNGGIEMGRESLNNGLKNGLCKTGENHLRREAVEGTVKVFPMKEINTVYGALITGDHLFYVAEGNSEKAEGKAKFSHLWLVKDGEWKMHRVFSYDHGPVQFESKKDAIVLSKEELGKLTGNYQMPGNDIIKVTSGENMLQLDAMGKSFTLHPETSRSFFSKERNLSFSFSSEAPIKLQIYEGENLVAEATRTE
ncbi:nuclear transport factor 2 family protein [Christiangramia sp. SM2212]|uniref:Nuclear transport factor 2 family protein n=1 Tax=Christiangramia sediminicola TaxID=3073267 RepID=A0ABU1ENK5_9FLAO|nr:nuclear transport factor 2 family protein [Christiangramia sp. SM2212]MDR5589975.1 nuclear transport factor 2 family protein [Christiangramia sp. SM2212]